LEHYLRYVDWAARLNVVVDEKSPLPAARLQVHEALRQRALLPLEVVRTVHSKEGQRLTARHTFFWTLYDNDREVIRSWEERVNRGELKKVPFDQYRAPPRHEMKQASR
jgi:hypothetical protein